MEILDKIFVGAIKTFIAFGVLYVVHTTFAEEAHKYFYKVKMWRKVFGVIVWTGCLILITLAAVAFAGDNCLSWSRDGECTWMEDRLTFEVRWFSMLAIALITGMMRLDSHKKTKQNDI